MKISKLFHWLYALLMLMPIFFIGFTCCYVVFNENAFESYYGETINDVEIKNVTNYDEISLSKKYTLFNETFLTFQQTGRVTLYVSNVVNYSDNRDISNTDRIALYSNIYNNIEHQYIVFFNGDTQITNYDFLNTRVKIDFVLNTFSYENNTNYYLPLIYQYTYNKYSYLDDVFEYSLDKLSNSSYFSWAYDSFLVEPFRFIGNLFSLPSNSVIYLFLSYWLDISIIYLVFDLVMYVPLLVHRWLDKGVLE